MFAGHGKLGSPHVCQPSTRSQPQNEMCGSDPQWSTSAARQVGSPQAAAGDAPSQKGAGPLVEISPVQAAPRIAPPNMRSLNRVKTITSSVKLCA